MFITESKLKKIIREEYTRLVEGDVVQGRFGGTNQGSDIDTTSSDEEALKADPTNLSAKAEEEDIKQLTKDTLNFTADTAREWGELYNEVRKKNLKLKSEKHTSGEVPKIMSPEEIKRQIKIYISDAREEMKNLLVSKKDQIGKTQSGYTFLKFMQDSLNGGGQLSLSVNALKDTKLTPEQIKEKFATPDLRRKSQEIFIDSFFKTINVTTNAAQIEKFNDEQKKTYNKYMQSALDYFHFYLDIMRIVMTKIKGKRIILRGGETFVPGKRDPFLHPKEETPAKEVPTKKPSHLTVVKQ